MFITSTTSTVAIFVAILIRDGFFLSLLFSVFTFRCLWTAILVSPAPIVFGSSIGGTFICSNSNRRHEALQCDFFHNPPIAGIVFFLGLFHRVPTVQGGLLDLFGFHLGLLAFFLGLEFVETPAFCQLHFSQAFRLVRCPGFLQEVPVVQCPRRRQSFRWIKLQQFFDEVDGSRRVEIHLGLVSFP
jgi:hypothetical protein